MISRTKKSQKAKPRSNFLNRAQRKALKESLMDRYSKDFGLRNPELVQKMICDFFKGAQEINSKTLADLEHRIKRAIIKGKSEEEIREERVAQETQEEQRRKATEAEEVEDPVEGVRDAVLTKIEMERRRKVVEGDLGLDYLDGILEEEMGLMSKNLQRTRLKNYLEEQKGRIEQKTKVLGQKIVKQELDLQKEEKEERRRRELAEQKKYEEAIREKIRDEELEREAEEREKEKEKKRTREVQDKIIRARRDQLDRQKRKEEAENQKLVQAIKEDLALQKRKEEERFQVGVTR